jgi:hypothetical protein
MAGYRNWKPAARDLAALTVVLLRTSMLISPIIIFRKKEGIYTGTK